MPLPARATALELCVGTIAEMTEGDVYDAVDRYSRQGKIAYIHLRNVVGKVPNYRETFIDEGDVDMIRILSILARNNFDGVIIPDHTPQMTCPAPWHAGMAHTIGFILAAQAMLKTSVKGRTVLTAASSASASSSDKVSSNSLIIAASRFGAWRSAVRLRQHRHQRRDSLSRVCASISMPPALDGPPGCALIGCTVGAAGAGAVVDRIGLKKGLATLRRLLSRCRHSACGLPPA